MQKKKAKRGLEARISPGRSLLLREGVEIVNIGNQTILIQVKTLVEPTGRPHAESKTA